MTSLGVDEEEEAELAPVGASLELPPGVRHSLPARESQRTGADETNPPVCMTKASWLTTSLPSPPPPFPFLPSLVFSTLLPKLLENGRDPGALLSGAGVPPGEGLRTVSYPAARPHAHFLRQLFHHQRSEPDERSLGLLSDLRDCCPIIPLIP